MHSKVKLCKVGNPLNSPEAKPIGEFYLEFLVSCFVDARAASAYSKLTQRCCLLFLCSEGEQMGQGGRLPYCIGIIAGGHLIDNKHVDKKTGRIQCEHGVAPLGLSEA